MHVLKSALMKGECGMVSISSFVAFHVTAAPYIYPYKNTIKLSSVQIPSFFGTLQSPAVEDYKHQQRLALRAAVASTNTCGRSPSLGLDASMRLQHGSNPFTREEASETTNPERSAVKAGRKTNRLSNRQATTAHQKTHQEFSKLGLDRSMRHSYLNTHQDFSMLGLDRSLISTKNIYTNLLEENKSKNEDNRDDIQQLTSGLSIASVDIPQELCTLGLDASTHVINNCNANMTEDENGDTEHMDSIQESTPTEGDGALSDLSTANVQASTRLSVSHSTKKYRTERGLACRSRLGSTLLPWSSYDVCSPH